MIYSVRLICTTGISLGSSSMPFKALDWFLSLPVDHSRQPVSLKWDRESLALVSTVFFRKVFVLRINKCLFMPPPLGAGGIMFSVRPSVCPKPEIPSFDLYMGPLAHPTNRKRFTACPSICPSVRPERFPSNWLRTYGGNGLKFYMLILTTFRTD